MGSGRRRHKKFADYEEFREKLDPLSSEVTSNRFNAGVWQVMKAHWCFLPATQFVLFLNLLWVGVETDWNKHETLFDAPLKFQFVNNLFCMFFLFEFTVRLKVLMIKDVSFYFTGLLVLLLCWETWMQPLLYFICGFNSDTGPWRLWIFKILQLTRICGQILRLWLFVPFFGSLAKGVMTGLRSIIITLVLLCCVTFTFAIIFVKMRTPVEDGCFDTVFFAMHCLMMQGIFSDQAQMIQEMFELNWTSYIVFLWYLIVGSLANLNLFIGVCCDVVNKVSEADEKTRRDQYAKEMTVEMLMEVDSDFNQLISVCES